MTPSMVVGKVRREFELALAVLLASLAIELGGCGTPQASNPTHSARTLTSISIAPSNPVVALGKSKQFKATGVFSDGTQQDMTQTVVWNSSQSVIATITPSGVAVSKQVGTTTIVAVSASITASTTLTVAQAALVSIVVTPPNPIVPKGNTQQLVATGTFTDGSTQNLTSSVAWTASPPGVVMVSSSGLATAQAVGISTLAANAGEISGQDTLTVAPAALVSIVVTPPSPIVAKGNTQQLVATGTFTDGSTQNLTSSVAWSATPPGVVTVSSSGLATAQAIGTTTLAATSGSISGQDKLTVAPAALVSIAVTPLNPVVPKGDAQQLTATGTFGDGSTQNLTSSVAWTVSPPGVATVSAIGLLTGQTQGTTMITASAGSISGTDTVVISAPVVVSIAVAPVSPSIPLGFQQQQFNATGTFSDGSQQTMTQTVTWAATQPEVATIDSSGLATTLQVGLTGVTAASGSVTGSATLTVTSPIMMGINYFTNANAAGLPSGTVNVSNPGVTGTGLCAMIYVFDQDEAMTECCGCSASIDDLRTLLVTDDLTSNPLNGQKSTRGIVKITPADRASNPSCDPTSVTPTGEVTAWSTRFQSPSDVTEGAFRPVLLSSTEESYLQDTCAAIKELGSGQGVCSCGSGD